MKYQQKKTITLSVEAGSVEEAAKKFKGGDGTEVSETTTIPELSRESRQEQMQKRMEERQAARKAT